MMKWLQILALTLTIGMAADLPKARAHPRFSIGFNFGLPIYPCPHHHYPYYYGYGYYRPRTIFIEQPVLVQPRPVVISQPAIAVPAQNSTQSPPPGNLPQSFTSTTSSATSNVVASSPQINQLLSLLTHPDAKVRSNAVIDLGKLKATQAVDPLAATLAGDQSPIVRDAAARALGLIGSPQALTALIHAAQADTDHDVRRSAQFAVEVIKAYQGVK